MRNEKGQFVKGITPWNKDKKIGKQPWMNLSGLKLGSQKGHPCWGGETGRFKKGHGLIGGGHSMPHSQETIEKFKIINKAKAKHGKDVWNWKGDKVGYDALHSWVERQLGKPDTCEECGKSKLKGRQIHWANISGDYIRDIADWRRLCAKCHGAFDASKRATMPITQAGFG